MNNMKKTPLMFLPQNLLKPGGIVAFSGRSWLAAGINLLSYGVPGWNISHVGILADSFDNGFPILDECGILSIQDLHGLILFESLMSCDVPCLIQNRIANGVQAHYPTCEYLKRDNPSVWYYPLYRELKPLEGRRLSRFLLDHLGTKYDKIGAVRVAGLGFSFLESLLHAPDLEYIFCSELVAASLNHIGIFNTKHVSRWSPNILLRRLRREGIIQKPIRIK